jgi:hypothetical protein
VAQLAILHRAPGFALVDLGARDAECPRRRFLGSDADDLRQALIRECVLGVAREQVHKALGAAS